MLRISIRKRVLFVVLRCTLIKATSKIRSDWVESRLCEEQFIYAPSSRELIDVYDVKNYIIPHFLDSRTPSTVRRAFHLVTGFQEKKKYITVGMNVDRSLFMAECWLILVTTWYFHPSTPTQELHTLSYVTTF